MPRSVPALRGRREVWKFLDWVLANGWFSPRVKFELRATVHFGGGMWGGTRKPYSIVLRGITMRELFDMVKGYLELEGGRFLYAKPEEIDEYTDDDYFFGDIWGAFNRCFIFLIMKDKGSQFLEYWSAGPAKLVFSFYDGTMMTGNEFYHRLEQAFIQYTAMRGSEPASQKVLLDEGVMSEDVGMGQEPGLPEFGTQASLRIARRLIDLADELLEDEY